jgi:hypothetical protein
VLCLKSLSFTLSVAYLIASMFLVMAIAESNAISKGTNAIVENSGIVGLAEGLEEGSLFGMDVGFWVGAFVGGMVDVGVVVGLLVGVGLGVGEELTVGVGVGFEVGAFKENVIVP